MAMPSSPRWLICRPGLILTTTVQVYPTVVTSYITLAGWQCIGLPARPPAAGAAMVMVMPKDLVLLHLH